MGSWGPGIFQNDDALDWVAELEESDNLSCIKEALQAATDAEEDYIEVDAGAAALAACEVLARLRGKPGGPGDTTESIDEWVQSHRREPSVAMLKLARSAIDRVLSPESSELRQLWDEGNAVEWLNTVEGLRQRLA